MEYSGTCATAQRPGVCSVSPVLVLQSQKQLVIEPLGAGVLEQIAVVFASDGIALCDLADAKLTFAGVYDGRDINGAVQGTATRAGIGECNVQSGEFVLERLAPVPTSEGP
jgi:hypothetical protein